jgi:hypothetical protein
MILVLGIGLFAALAATFGLYFSRRSRGVRRRIPVPVPSVRDPKHQEMTDLFVARLRSGAIGIPELVRLFLNEGRSSQAIAGALADAMSRFPRFATRADQFETWLRDGERVR